jgi:hypothetical protein
MMLGDVKRLRMFAGPNGSGKTSLVRDLAKEFSPQGLFQLHQFVNADDIYRDLHTGKTIAWGYGGRCLGRDQVREALISGGRLRQDHPFLTAVPSARRTAPSYLTIPDQKRSGWPS